MPQHDALFVVVSSAVSKVISVHDGDDGVPEFHRGHGLSQVLGFFWVERRGRLMVPTAQNRHPRVHSCPAIMKVASPLAQHSWMFGHRLLRRRCEVCCLSQPTWWR